jgi:hypothetical protein
MFVRSSPNQGGDFFLQDGGEGHAHGFTHRLSQIGLEVVLTKLARLIIFGSRSHGILL